MDTTIERLSPTTVRSCLLCKQPAASKDLLCGPCCKRIKKQGRKAVSLPFRDECEREFDDDGYYLDDEDFYA